MTIGPLLICLLLPVLSHAQVNFENLSVDTTITGFHLAQDSHGTRIYTPNGPADMRTVNPSAFSFSIMEKANKENGLKQLGWYRRMSLSQGYEPSHLVELDTIIAGFPVIGWSLRETMVGSDYENRVFEAFYVKDSTVVLFISGDLDRGKHIDNFRQTFFKSVH